jgi:hypothetical protein
MWGNASHAASDTPYIGEQKDGSASCLRNAATGVGKRL